MSAAQPPPSNRQRVFRLEAVILRHIDWGEADRLLWVFSLELGKMRLLAKGARKPRSRKAGHLEPFTRSNLLASRTREIPLVTQAETLDAYLPLREDLLRTTYASYVVELTDRFTYEEGENRPLYHLLVDTLSRLCQDIDLDLAARYFELRLLDHVGFRPQLFQCVRCGAPIQAVDQYFSANQGGVLCPNCGDAESRPVSMETLKYLRHFQRSNFSDAARAHPTQAESRAMENLLQYYLTYLLERSLNAPVFIRRLKR
jgi:DNA repair protein RecO (recombination protein O)